MFPIDRRKEEGEGIMHNLLPSAFSLAPFLVKSVSGKTADWKEQAIALAVSEPLR